LFSCAVVAVDVDVVLVDDTSISYITPRVHMSERDQRVVVVVKNL